MSSSAPGVRNATAPSSAGADGAGPAIDGDRICSVLKLLGSVIVRRSPRNFSGQYADVNVGRPVAKHVRSGQEARLPTRASRPGITCIIARQNWPAIPIGKKGEK